ncbi:MAG: hypothetical protein KH431_08735 [Erysipelotrichaceae bacterium]|nr:hypothetical protein [Erysipelotrichaceae bacterium]
MKKRLSRIAGAVLLVFMTTIFAMPVTSVFAAGTPTATILDGTYELAIGYSYAEGEYPYLPNIVVYVNDDNVKNLNNGDDVSTWITNLPDGLHATCLSVTPQGNGRTRVAIALEGTPTTIQNDTIEITIPADKLDSGTALTVTENPNAVFEVHKMTATVSDTIIRGNTDTSISTGALYIYPEAIINIAENTDVSSWFTNMPSGLKATFDHKGSNNALLIFISGKPTNAKNEAMQIVIPKAAFNGNEDLKVSTNPNAEWAINKREAKMTNDVEIKGTAGERIFNKLITIDMQNEVLNSVPHYTKQPVSNLPKGLKIDFSIAASTSTFDLIISGTPTAYASGILEITIPGEWLESETDLKVTVNPNAFFDIKNIEVTAGAGATHKLGNGQDMMFTCSGKLDNLSGIYVDGALVDPNNYTLQSGSTILSLKADYLNKLTAGNHTLKFQYKDNIFTEASFTIIGIDDNANTPIDTNKSANTNRSVSPNTGDTTHADILTALIILSVGVIGGLIKKRMNNQRG